MSSGVRYVQAGRLHEWIAAAFRGTGMPRDDAEHVAQMLVQTSLWGIDSHGIARVPHYLERLRRRSVLPAPELVFQRTGSSTGDLDGGHGHGFVVCRRAMTEAISIARDTGVGVVGIRNSSHCGAIGLYTRQATAAGMIGIALTHTDALVVPEHGTAPFFGTNPISIALPTRDPARPLCLDMATSVVPWNRVLNARRENTRVPHGWGIDAAGNETDDPHAIVAAKPMAGHKGYALAFVIDMLCGPLNGMTFGPHVSHMYATLDERRYLGSLVLALDPGRFFGGDTLLDAIGSAISEVKQQGDAVMFPGEPEYRAEESRRTEGIPIEPVLWTQFAAWSDTLELPSLVEK